jgi:prepilin peptidase CpaA
MREYALEKGNYQMVFAACAMLCALAGAIFDLRSQRIPNRFTFPAMLFGLLLHATLGGWRQLGAAAAGGLVCGFTFLVFHLAGGMGGGDVKLITAVGCAAGLSLAGHELLWTSLAGGIIAVAFATYRGRFKQTMRNVGVLAVHHGTRGLAPHGELNLANAQALRMPYALAVAAGSGLSFCLLIGRR